MQRLINFQVIFKIVSRNLFIIAFFLLVCIPVALNYQEDSLPFFISSVIAFLLGLFLFWATKKQDGYSDLHKKEAYFIVTLSWIIMSLIGCLPYLISGAIPSFVDAFFESVSGFSTTGSSILVDIEVLPKSILFWRSLTHWIGGIGIIVMVIIVMPALQIGAYHLFTMESSLQEKIQPRIKAVGNRLLFIYTLLTVSEIILLLAGGMNLFESACHAFGTVATGGFSPKNTSLAGYSPYIQYVVTIFMFLAGTNFIIHYHIMKRNFKKVKENEELRFYMFVVLSAGLVVTGILFFKMHKPLELSFRESFFQVISIITCTGFASAEYLLWPTYGWFIIFLLMFMGGSTGSTAGGIKMARHLILWKNISRIFRQLSSPKAILHIRFNKSPLSEETNSSILTFISLYIMIFLIGSILLVSFGVDWKTAAGSVATTMAGIGPGIGTVGPVSNFAHLPEVGKVLLSFLMLIGRLEIYTFIMLFSPSFWRR